MPFFPPDSGFGPEHSARDTAPDGFIKLIITSDGHECAGPMQVEVIEANGEVLADGEVHTGTDEPYSLPLKKARPLGVTTARIRFRCGAEEADGSTDMIWLKRSRP